MFYIAAIFVKYCYRTGSWLFWLMSLYTMFGLLTARGKIIVEKVLLNFPQVCSRGSNWHEVMFQVMAWLCVDCDLVSDFQIHTPFCRVKNCGDQQAVLEKWYPKVLYWYHFHNLMSWQNQYEICKTQTSKHTNQLILCSGWTIPLILNKSFWHHNILLIWLT